MHAISVKGLPQTEENWFSHVFHFLYYFFLLYFQRSLPILLYMFLVLTLWGCWLFMAESLVVQPSPECIVQVRMGENDLALLLPLPLQFWIIGIHHHTWLSLTLLRGISQHKSPCGSLLSQQAWLYFSLDRHICSHSSALYSKPYYADSAPSLLFLGTSEGHAIILGQMCADWVIVFI